MSGASSSKTCWTEIGIAGNGQCPKLAEFIHCRNCPVYIERGRGLLDREMPEAYRDEWTALLARAKEAAPEKTISLLVFRLGKEWLALPTGSFARVAPEKPVHTIPHRSGPVLRGLVNIDGELLLCVSLEGLLGVEPAVASTVVREMTSARMVVIRIKERRWAFLAEEVDAIHHVDVAVIAQPPVTAMKAAVSFATGLFSLSERSVAILDDEALGKALNKVMAS